ncbi:MAG: lipoprotein-releasing ABC transporter permease subunit [Cardiobacteriaceae bacterium]|nr:lipoprotein-releasing ABC transporter permease subunit [Cardiobacteriaceae bacterium]
MRFLPTAIGFRYSYARRGSHFVGLNSILAVIGITIGIAALIVVLSVMNGVVSDVRDRLLSMTAQLSIRASDGRRIPPDFSPEPFLRTDSRIISYAPYIDGQALIGIGQGFQGVMLHGVEPSEEGKISDTFARISPEVRARLQDGSWDLILGKVLAEKLGLQIGDKITVIVPQATTTAAGLMPRLKRFTYAGYFESGHYQYDKQLVMLHAADARKLLQIPDGVSGYQIKIKDAMEAPLIRKAIAPKLPMTVYMSDWSLDQAVYFNAVQMEKNAMFIILCLIVMVAAFGLLSSMYMVVTEKRRDIAILRTLGLTRADIAQIFISQGMIFGIIGTVLGVSLGIIIALNVPFFMDLLEKWTGYTLPAQMYFVEQLTAKIEPSVVIGISVITLVMTLLFSVIPAIIAAKTEPARALSAE